jgi:hypothetical protein
MFSSSLHDKIASNILVSDFRPFEFSRLFQQQTVRQQKTSTAVSLTFTLYKKLQHFGFFSHFPALFAANSLGNSVQLQKCRPII